MPWTGLWRIGARYAARTLGGCICGFAGSDGFSEDARTVSGESVLRLGVDSVSGGTAVATGSSAAADLDVGTALGVEVRPSSDAEADMLSAVPSCSSGSVLGIGKPLVMSRSSCRAFKDCL